jgi:penicillin-binding protein 2
MNSEDLRGDARTKCALLTGFALSCVAGLLWFHWRQAGYREQAQAAFENDAVRVASLWTYRAPVCDRYGTPLNVTVDEFALAIQPSAVRDIRSTRRQTLDLVEAEMSRLAIDLWGAQAQFRRVPREEIEAHLLRASPMPLILWRNLDREALQRWLLARGRYPSVELVRLPKRVYHLPELAPMVRGRVYLTRRGDGDTLRDCDYPDLTMGGWFGVERFRDTQLRGQPGRERLFLDAVLFRQQAQRQADPVTGRPVLMTLDLALQQWAQEAMGGFCGGLVILRTDGDILALADAGGTVPPLALSADHREWGKRLAGKGLDGVSRCLMDATAPGSIVKPLVAFAALEAGVITPETRFECTGRVLYGRNTAVHCHNESGHGSVNLYQALGLSCNAYFLQVAERVGWARIQSMMLAAGLGQLPGQGATPADAPGAVLDAMSLAGLIHCPDTKRDHYRRLEDQVWRPIDTGFLAIGQADTRVTPVQAAVMAVAVATGRRVRPRLLVDEPMLSVELPVSLASREAVMQGLRMAVHHPRGTGRSVRVEGVTLAAKTGTSQVGPAGSSRKDVWMVVMYPGFADGVRLVIAAMAHDQTSGGRDFGPRLARLVQHIQEWEQWNEDRRRQWPDGTNAAAVAQALP